MAEPSLTEALERLLEAVVATHDRLADGPVARPVEVREVREEIEVAFDLATGAPAGRIVQQVVRLLEERTLHVTHPRYYGLFNPSVVPIAVIADALVAVYNPQLAVWEHAPAAQEMETLALAELGSLLGWDEVATAHFTSGGQEANATAVVAALVAAYPQLPRVGLARIGADPTLYLSEAGHDSLLKIAAINGLGHQAVRRVPMQPDGRMDVAALRRMLASDRAQGRHPFLIVATGGATATGVIDPIDEIAVVAADEEVWLHVDAAWGGAALLSERLRGALVGIERADSVTWDAHKWLSVPVAAGMFFSRHPDAGVPAFAVAAKYVPPSAGGTRDPYVTTMQWSRRCIGLKVLMALAERGRDGYAAMIERQARMGDLLRRRLRESGWRLRNATPLPLVCFDDPELDAGGVPVADVAAVLNAGGRAWMSTVRVADGGEAMRACICSYRTTPEDIEATIAALEQARRDAVTLVAERDG